MIAVSLEVLFKFSVGISDGNELHPLICDDE